MNNYRGQRFAYVEEYSHRPPLGAELHFLSSVLYAAEKTIGDNMIVGLTYADFDPDLDPDDVQ